MVRLEILSNRGGKVAQHGLLSRGAGGSIVEFVGGEEAEKVLERLVSLVVDCRLRSGCEGGWSRGHLARNKSRGSLSRAFVFRGRVSDASLTRRRFDDHLLFLPLSLEVLVLTGEENFVESRLVEERIERANKIFYSFQIPEPMNHFAVFMFLHECGGRGVE